MSSEEDVIEFDEESDPGELAPWYSQFLKLSESKRNSIADQALEKIRKHKPVTHQFIKKFGCRLVGITPRVEYACLNKSEGELDVTYIHSFSMPTLLYWCESGKFGFFVNVNLDYDDTVLNKVKGNQKDRSIKGFTA